MRHALARLRRFASRTLRGAPPGPVGQQLEMLPGTPHARYAAPLDYRPSRAYGPRWGYGAVAPLPWLSAWLNEYSDSHRAMIAEMSHTATHMQDVAEAHDDHGPLRAAWYDVPYTPFDSVALCTMLRVHRPATYLEIGSGMSTCFARYAVHKFNLPTKIISIDPEPRQAVDLLCDEVMRFSLETASLDLFERLAPGDILFLDGSHRSFMNSDVTVFFGDVLPRLKPGVIVHIHDIMLPFDYPAMFENWYWNEQYLLMSLLLGGRDKITPLLPTYHICSTSALLEGFAPPPGLARTDGFRFGGAMWFTLTQPLG